MKATATTILLAGACLLLVTATLVAAPGRRVSLLLVNHTGDVRGVTIYTPAGRMFLGSFSRGGRLGVVIPVYDARSAIVVVWEAGDQGGQFIIGPDTPAYLRIDIMPSGPIGP